MTKQQTSSGNLPSTLREPTARQRRFAMAYVETLCGAEAARRAGYKPRSAAFQASSLLRNPNVKQLIEQLVLERAELTRSVLIEELASVALSNADDFFSWDNGEELREVLDDGTTVIREIANVHLRPSRELTRRQKSAVKSIIEKIGADGRRSVELQMHDKLRAVELLGRALGLFGTTETNISIGITNKPVGAVEVTYVDPPTIEGDAHEVPDAHRR